MSVTLAWASSSSVQRARPFGGIEQAVATSFLLARELALRAGARLLAERGFQIAFDETPFGPHTVEPPTPTLSAISSSHRAGAPALRKVYNQMPELRRAS